MRGELLLEEIIKDKHINDYYVKLYLSGISVLTISTDEKWIDYAIWEDHNGTVLQVRFKDFDKDTPHEMKLYNLKFKKPSNTIKLEQQNKDQISIYYIPYELLDIKIPNK